MALKTRKKRIEAPAIGPRRKAKFQADLAPAEDRSMRLLKEELQLTSNTDFLSDALALFRWAVSERKLGHRIVSESASGETSSAEVAAASLEIGVTEMRLFTIGMPNSRSICSATGTSFSAADVTRS